MDRILQTLWYRPREGLLAKLLLCPLWVVSLVFGLVVASRRRRLPPRARRLSARVISVGNLTAGGAGKTPVAIHVARLLQASGKRPAVLSRGYGRAEPGVERIVSDGERVLEPAARAGDEPVLIARSCPGVPVLVGPDRASLGDEAIARFGARTLVLDDGFQHLRLARDLDLVVVDASNPFGNGHLVPRGPLRERREALRQAGLVWLSKVDQAPAGEVDALAEQIRVLSGKEPVRAAYRLAELCQPSGARSAVVTLKGARVLMLAGLARPESFRKTLQSAGAEIVGEALYADHHWFSAPELDAARAQAGRSGAELIALTEKDAVRLPAGLEAGPFVVIRIESEILTGAEALAGLL